MKSIRIFAVAAVGVVALAFAALALADTSFKSSVSAEYVSGSDQYAESFFKGTVKSNKGKCFKGRKVIVTTKPDDEKVGSDITDNDGKFKVSASGFGEGKYSVTAEKSKFTGNGAKQKTKTCEEATATVKVNAAS